MPQKRVRAGFGIFVALCAMFSVNLFAFQSAGTAAAAKRIIFPGTKANQETPLAFEGGGSSPAVNVAANALLPLAISNSVAPVTTGSVSEPDLIRAIQRELQGQGYEAGGVDGVAGLTTRAAVMAFEWDQGLPLTGEPSQPTLQALLLGGRGSAAGIVSTALQATQVIRSVQQGLTALGYGEFKAPGTVTPETQRAIRLFEVHEGMTETGRISGTLASRVARLSSEKRLAGRR